MYDFTSVYKRQSRIAIIIHHSNIETCVRDYSVELYWNVWYCKRHYITFDIRCVCHHLSIGKYTWDLHILVFVTSIDPGEQLENQLLPLANISSTKRHPQTSSQTLRSNNWWEIQTYHLLNLLRNIYLYMYMYFQVCVCVCVRVRACVCVCVHTCMCTNTHIQCKKWFYHLFNRKKW